MLRLAFAVVLIGISDAAFAQEVTLSSRDGGVSVTGVLRDYDGELYRLETAFGTLTLDGSAVTCTGASCPEPGAFVAEFSFAGPAWLTGGLLPGLLASFAKAEGYVLKISGSQFVLSDPATGQPAGRITVVDQGAIAADGTSTVPDFLLFRGVPPSEAADRWPVRHVFAIDALIPAVSPQNPVSDITVSTLSDVLEGKIIDWTELGGAEAAIVLDVPGPKDTERVNLAVFGLGQVSKEATNDDWPVMKTDPFVLSLRPLSELGEFRPLDLRGSCGISLPASESALRTDGYPLTTPIYLGQTPGRPPRLAREFIAYARSQAVQRVIRESGFVDQSLERRPFVGQGRRLATSILTGANAAGLREVQRMVADLRDHDQISMAFRFQDGSSRLDPQSSSNIRALANELDRGTFDGHEIIVAGFSDGIGHAASNLRLSRQRARAVRDELLSEVSPSQDNWREDLVAKGYGEAAPIACDDTDWGRQLNRRVEIWVRQR